MSEPRSLWGHREQPCREREREGRDLGPDSWKGAKGGRGGQGQGELASAQLAHGTLAMRLRGKQQWKGESQVPKPSGEKKGDPRQSRRRP